MIFSETEVELFEASRGGNEDDDGAEGDDAAVAAKPCLRAQEIDVYKVNDRYYFICGEKEIFLLNECEQYSVKLSDDEIDALGFEVVWLGGNTKTVFEADDKKAVEAVVDIVVDYTSMVKNKEFHGFSIATLVTHFRAFLYGHIVEEQRDFYTSITLSGEQRGTGKPIHFKLNKTRLNYYRVFHKKVLNAFQDSSFILSSSMKYI